MLALAQLAAAPLDLEGVLRGTLVVLAILLAVVCHLEVLPYELDGRLLLQLLLVGGGRHCSMPETVVRQNARVGSNELTPPLLECLKPLEVEANVRRFVGEVEDTALFLFNLLFHDSHRLKLAEVKIVELEVIVIVEFNIATRSSEHLPSLRRNGMRLLGDQLARLHQLVDDRGAFIVGDQILLLGIEDVGERSLAIVGRQRPDVKVRVRSIS